MSVWRMETSDEISQLSLLSRKYVCCSQATHLLLLHTNVKDKDKPEDRQEAVLKIKCCNCQATYIGETGRNLSTRLTERKRATRNGDVNNYIADHHLQTKHQIDWDSATCITYSQTTINDSLQKSGLLRTNVIESQSTVTGTVQTTLLTDSSKTIITRE